MFTTRTAYWNFAQSVRSKYRLARTSEQQAFLDELLSLAQNCVDVVPEGVTLYRAQIGFDWQTEGDEDEQFEVPGPYSRARMNPLRDRATEGRVNPKGIPCFYCATHLDTAIAEVRPWVGSYVSVGQFEVLRNLQVVNVTTERKLQTRVWIADREPDPEICTQYVREAIDIAFSEPVDRSDDIADYAPTQLMAEHFRLNGYDGVAYSSSVGPEHNIALFDLDAVTMRSGHLYQIKSLKLESSQAANPYYVQKVPSAKKTTT